MSNYYRFSKARILRLYELRAWRFEYRFGTQMYGLLCLRHLDLRWWLYHANIVLISLNWYIYSIRLFVLALVFFRYSLTIYYNIRLKMIHILGGSASWEWSLRLPSTSFSFTSSRSCKLFLLMFSLFLLRGELSLRSPFLIFSA